MTITRDVTAHALRECLRGSLDSAGKKGEGQAPRFAGRNGERQRVVGLLETAEVVHRQPGACGNVFRQRVVLEHQQALEEPVKFRDGPEADFHYPRHLLPTSYRISREISLYRTVFRTVNGCLKPYRRQQRFRLGSVNVRRLISPLLKGLNREMDIICVSIPLPAGSFTRHLDH